MYWVHSIYWTCHSLTQAEYALDLRGQQQRGIAVSETEIRVTFSVTANFR